MQLIKKIRNNAFKLLHPGKKCYCLYCNMSYGKFLHKGVKSEVFKKYKVAGGGYKKNAQCPNCGSSDRARLLALFFTLRTNIFNKKTDLLHISPDRHIANFIDKNAKVNQVIGALEIDQFKEYDPIEIDIQKMDLDNEQYEVILCCHVLEHVDDDEKAMREIYRVLKPNGFAILQIPLALNLNTTLEDKSLKTKKERKIAFGQVDHVRLYGLDYFDKLQMAGFRVIRDNPFDNNWLNTQELAKHRLDRIEDVIVAYKE